MPAGITDLKPCAKCGGPIIPFCHRVVVDTGVVQQQNLQQFLGMHEYFGRQSVDIAALFTPGANEIVKFTTDVDPSAGTTLFFCNNCWCSGEIDLPMCIERDNELAKRRSEKNGAGSSEEVRTESDQEA